MIRRSPCELYLRFLVVHPDGYSTSAIRDICRNQALDFVSEAYVDGLRAEMPLPSPFQPTNKLHRRSQEFLFRHQLVGFFHPDEPAKRAHQLLHKPRAKEAIEAMSLAGEKPAFIALKVRQLGYPCTLEAVKRYQAFYWNLELVDSTEVNAILRMRVDSLVVPAGREPTVDEHLQYKALDKARRKDARLVVSEMPITPMAAVLNQLRMGFMPGQLELTRLAGAARVAATARALEAAVTGGPYGASTARDYALTAKMMTELLNDLGNPDADLQRDLQQFVLETERGEVPTLESLSTPDAEYEESHAVERE